jgi:cytochrome c553
MNIAPMIRMRRRSVQNSLRPPVFPSRLGSVRGAALLIAAGLALFGCVTKQYVGNSPTVEGTVQVCSSCHGFEGRSENPRFPILAAQQHDYLVAQLKSFRDKTRADPHAHTYMWGMAAKLSDATIDGVATFYSKQAPAPGREQDPALVAGGAAIFKSGIAAREVPACSACHGDTGLGNSTIPRLAGQHQTYIIDQLQAFQINSRNNELMHANAKNLSAQEIRELAAYVATL